MIDTHCHLTYDGLHNRIDEVLANAAEAGVDRMICVGTTPADAEKASALSKRFDNVYFTAGLHPHYAEGYTDKAALLDALREKLSDPQCVAIGEMGLDRHYPDPPFDLQQRVFGWQLELAAELGVADSNAGVAGVERSDPPEQTEEDTTLTTRSGGSPSLLPGHPKPIVIHNREATDDTLPMLRTSGIAPERFVFHCFTGSAEELDQILAFGAMVSLTGIVTFGSAKALAEASDRIPLNRLMIETDSPYLTPAPHRKVRPNEPRYVADVARFLAQRRGLSLDEFVYAVDGNAKTFFSLD
ncbi:MAG: TatD family hydrolase [Planctomycetota bacterium]